MNLYKIATEYQIALNDSYIDDDISSQINQFDKLNELIGDIEDKAVNIASYIKNLEIESESVRLAIKEMQQRAKSLDTKAEQLSSYLKLNLESCGLKEIRKSPHFVIKVKSNPASVVIDDENLISDEYKKVKQVISIDKLAIKNDIENGVIVDGARIVKNTRLEIK